MPVTLAPLTKLPAPLEGYTLLERLGRGGFGEVWKAEAPGGLMKAIKFVFGDLDSDEEEGRPARQEEKALKRVKNIRHPYVLSLERYDNMDGQLVIVMELADRNLWDRFRECHSLGMPGIPREELMKYMEETAEALDLMNNHYHIQHLDIKPQNLFLVFNHVKVGDFGLAKVLEGVRGTITGGVTPVYAGPETFNGDVSRFTDQYSLAIVFQEMLCGRRPYTGGNTKQLVMQHLTGIPDLEPLPPGDRPVIARGLSKDPEQRRPSCSEMVRALKQSGSASTNHTPITIQTRMTRTLPAQTAQQAASMFSAAMTAQRGHDNTGQAGTAPRGLGMLSPGYGANPSTPLPALSTPKLVTPQAAAAASGGSPMAMASPAMTLQRPVVMQTTRMSSLGIAEPERLESGVLMPALIVGVGETGLRVVRNMKWAIQERFGSIDAAPHIRFLFIDTDPTLTSSAIDPNDPNALPVSEVVAAKLNRPAHYLQREGIPSVEQWMPPGVLYRLPREASPANGVRAFGRLALVDHYRTIAQRIRQQIETIITDDALDKVASATGLGVRTNRARVYIVANLAGGTGSGMAIDLAYIVRHELRQIGYTHVDCVGFLAIPPVESGRGLANAFAALTELGHFHRGRNKYNARFDTKEPPITDSDGPFRRVALLQLGKRAELKEQNRLAGLAARAMFLDLFTPLGRRSDEVRVEADKLNPDRVPTVQPFGLYRLSWPRPAVLTSSTRCFEQRMIAGWINKDTTTIRESVQQWLDENWALKGFGLEEVVAKFHMALREQLREDPKKIVAAFLDAVRPKAATSRLEPQAAADTLNRVIELVGKPEVENESPGTIHGLLAAALKPIAKEAEKCLYNWTGWFVEHPSFRLPGAEEANSQIRDRVKRTAEVLESTRGDLAHDVHESYLELFPLLGSLGSAGHGIIGPRRSTVGLDLLNSGQQYAKKRLNLLVLDITLSFYRAMSNITPECMREVHAIRQKLTEISHIAGGNGEPVCSPGPGRMILPQGITSLDAAADVFIGAIPAQDIVDFELNLQAEITKRYGGIVGVCTKPASAALFLPWFAAKCREFLDLRLEETDPAAVFFRHKELGAKTEKLLNQAFEESAPDITTVGGHPQTEATILACPAGDDGDRFRALMQTLLPDVGFIPAPLPDDIVFLREYPLLPLADVPQLSRIAREAYEQQLSEYSPHTRGDIPWVIASGSG